MKVLLINSLYPPNVVGGAEISVQSIAESLAKKGIKTVVATLSQFRDGRRNCRGVTIYEVRLRNVYWPFNHRKNEIYRMLWHTTDAYNPFMARQILRIIRQEQPDIIHTNNLAGFSVSIWRLANKLKIPLLHTIRDYYLLCHLSTMFRNGNNCNKQCLRCRLFSCPKKCISYAPTAVSGISQYILDRHRAAGFFPGVNDFHVIPNGYGGIKNKPQKPPADELRLGYLGRITREKGIENMLKCLCNTKSPRYRIHIGGTGSSSFVAEVRQKYQNIVQFHGYLKRSVFFDMIDVLIVPSLWNEPFGRIIIEAFNYGVPVIGTERGGIPEVIEEGKTGYLYNPDNKDSLMNAIAKFSADPNRLQSMRNNCFNQSAKFAPVKIAEKYIEIFTNML